MTFTMVPRLIVATCGGTGRPADHGSSFEEQPRPQPHHRLLQQQTQDAVSETEPSTPSPTHEKEKQTRSRVFFSQEQACSEGAQRPVWQPRDYFLQKDISVSDRNTACLGMKKVCERLGLSSHVAGTSYLILDLVLSRIQVKPRLLHIVAVACMHLAIGLERDDTSDASDDDDEQHGEDATISDEALLQAAEAAFTVGDMYRMRRLLACKLPARDDMPRRPHHIVGDLMEHVDLASCIPRVASVQRSLSPIPEDKVLVFEPYPGNENTKDNDGCAADDGTGDSRGATKGGWKGKAGSSHEASDSSATDDDDDDDDDGNDSNADDDDAGDVGKGGEEQEEDVGVEGEREGLCAGNTASSRGRTKYRSRRNQPPSSSRPHLINRGSSSSDDGLGSMLSLRRPLSPPSLSPHQQQQQKRQAAEEEAERQRRARVVRLARAKAAAYGLVYRNVASCNARAYSVACVASAMRRVYGRVQSQALVFGMEAQSGLSDDALRQAAWFRCLTEGTHRVTDEDTQPDRPTRAGADTCS